MIHVRRLYQYEYEMVSEWFGQHYGNNLDYGLMSEDGFLAVSSDGNPIAAMFFYSVINSDMALFGWPVSDPESDAAMRNVALDSLFKAIEEHAKFLGYKYLTSYASKNSVALRLEKHGFMLGDSPVTQYVKIL